VTLGPCRLGLVADESVRKQVESTLLCGERMSAARNKGLSKWILYKLKGKPRQSVRMATQSGLATNPATTRFRARTRSQQVDLLILGTSIAVNESFPERSVSRRSWLALQRLVRRMVRSNVADP